VSVGDRVVVLRSPYDCVKAGAVGTITKIVWQWPWHDFAMLTLSGLECSHFWDFEVVPAPEEE